MIDFLLSYLIIGLILTAIIEHFINKNTEGIENIPDDLKMSNFDRVITVLLWPLAILFIIFG